MKYTSQKRKSKSLRSSLLFGISFSTLSFFTLVLLSSIILSKIKDPLGASGIASFAVLFVTGALSGFFTAKYKGDNGIFPVLISAFVFVIALLGAGLIGCGGKVSSITFINLVSYVILAMLFAVLAKKRGRIKRPR